MNILAENEDEGLGMSRLFFLSVIRTCPFLRESKLAGPGYMDGRSVGRLIQTRDKFSRLSN